MSIAALLTALIYIAIVVVIGWVLVSIIPATAPPVLKTIIWAFIAIVCLLLLLAALTGGVSPISLR